MIKKAIILAVLMSSTTAINMRSFMQMEKDGAVALGAAEALTAKAVTPKDAAAAPKDGGATPAELATNKAEPSAAKKSNDAAAKDPEPAKEAEKTKEVAEKATEKATEAKKEVGPIAMALAGPSGHPPPPAEIELDPKINAKNAAVKKAIDAALARVAAEPKVKA